MGADVSRVRFDPLRDFAGVVLQQGRLLLDADFNEFVALLDRRLRAETIDLTSFGPFYGDVGSDLDDYEASLRKCTEIDARWYGTSHQSGVIEGSTEFRRRATRFAAVIGRREERLVTFDLPGVAGIPIGHGDRNWPFPVGARAALDLASGLVEVEEAAVQ